VTHDGNGTRPEDLSALSRRGALSPFEERELERALGTSATLRVAHAVGVDLDRSTAMRAGDEALISRAADAALARVVRAASQRERVDMQVTPRHGPRRVAAMLVAAALITATGMAGAWWTGASPVPAFVQSVLPVVITSHLPGHHRRAKPAEPRAGGTAIAPPPESPPVATAAQAPLAESAPAATVRVPPQNIRPMEKRTSDTAPELFSRANAARRSGDLPRAEHLYSELIARYPTSDEARLSQITLGKLLLASGEPAQAEREFRRYLSASAAPLAEEALVNQAESFRAMNRAGDERKAWQRLLAQHPGSVYAARARARLETLGP
jgi:TolA-binding protein